MFVHALGKRIITPVLIAPEEARRSNNVVPIRRATRNGKRTRTQRPAVSTRKR